MGRKMELDTAILTDMKAVGADSFKALFVKNVKFAIIFIFIPI